MGQQHQDKWLDHLPFVLLGRRVAHQPDIGASSCELVLGSNVRIPGQILKDPGEIESVESLQQLLKQVRTKTSLAGKPTSNHCVPEKLLPKVPESATHAYTRQHQTTGLQAPYEGPFKIVERLSNSTIKLEVGQFKDGTPQYEIRHLNDIKFAHENSLAAEVQRPKRGRPARAVTSSPSDVSVSTDANLQPQSIFLGNRFPDPPLNTAADSKQSATESAADHETSYHERQISPSSANDEFRGVITGPPPAQAFNRPVRSTRNPNPSYIDSFWLASAISQSPNCT